MGRSSHSLAATLTLASLLSIGFSQTQCNTLSTEGTCNADDTCVWTEGRCACASTVDMDIIYALDSSQSIGEEDFQTEKDWVVQMLDSAIPQGARTAFIRFASKVEDMLSLVQSESMTIAERQQFLEDEVAYTAGWTDTTGAIDNSITMFESESPSDTRKVLFIITDGNPNAPDGDNNVCSRSQTLHDMGVTVAIIGVGDLWDAATMDCLATDEKYIMEVDDYSQDSLDEIMDVIQETTCPVSYDFMLTEVQLDLQSDGRGSRFIEIYNQGENVPLSRVTMSGIFEGRIQFEDDDVTMHLNQSQYLVLYDEGVDPPSCQDCDCQLNGTLCQNAKYVGCCDDGCPCWFAGLGMNNEDWEQRFTDSSNSNSDIEYLSYDPSTWISIFLGFTYTLQSPGVNNQKGANWLQSCNVRGTPGSARITHCNWTCTDDQCQQNGDSGSDCDDNECDCSSDDNYYFSDRTCQLVPPPSDCYAYWIYNYTSGEELVKYEWQRPQTDATVNYTLTYPTNKGGNDKVQTQWRTKTVADFGKYDDYEAVAGYVQTNIDGTVSTRIECTSVSRAPTMRPSGYPTSAPTKRPTSVPTAKPTFDSPRLYVSGDICEYDRCECYQRSWDCTGDDIYKNYESSGDTQFISVNKWPIDYPYFLRVWWNVELLSQDFNPDNDNQRRRILEDAFHQSAKGDSFPSSSSLRMITEERASEILSQMGRSLLEDDNQESLDGESSTTMSPSEFGISPKEGSLVFNGTYSGVEKIALQIQFQSDVTSSDDRYRLYRLNLYQCDGYEGERCFLVYPNQLYMVVDTSSTGSSSTQKSEKEMPTWIWYLFAAMLVFLAILCWLVYKYWWKNRQTKAQLVETEEELDRAFEDNELGFGRDLDAGDITFNPIATGAPGAVKAPQMANSFIEKQKGAAILDRADIAVEKFKVKNEMGQGKAQRQPGLRTPLLG